MTSRAQAAANAARSLPCLAPIEKVTKRSHIESPALDLIFAAEDLEMEARRRRYLKNFRTIPIRRRGAGHYLM